MSTATSLGRDPLFLSSSSSKSDRAAAIKIRFADIIVKSSSNKSEALMKIRREKEFLQRKQLEEKARIKIRQEARLAVMKMEEDEEEEEFLERKQDQEERMKIRQGARLAVMKVEEDARLNRKFEHPLSDLKELLNLCGGSRQASNRSFFKQFGLVLTNDIDDDLLDDLEEGEIF